MIHWGVVATGVFTLLVVYWQFFSVAVLEGSDFILHAKFAYRMVQEGQFTTPHFIYQIILVGVAELFGASYYAASRGVAIASNLFLFAVLCVYFNHSFKNLAVAAVAAFCLHGSKNFAGVLFSIRCN